MYSKKTITRLFGSKVVDQIHARQTGGLSGQKGTRFEDLFAVFKLSEELSFCYGGTTTKYKNVRRAIVQAQVFALIDDVAVQKKNPRMVEHYQLKNVKRLSWGTDSLARDFVRQKRLCNEDKIKSRLFLVVPNWRLRRKLQMSASSQVSKCARVMEFPYKSIALLVQTHTGFRSALIKLSPFSHGKVENEKLLTLAKFVIGHWFTANNRLSVDNLATALEIEAGAFCRPMKGTRAMPSKVAKLLSGIPKFKWRLHKGFLSWSCGTTDNGRYPHHCWSREFNRLLVRILKERPKSFEAIEGDLR